MDNLNDDILNKLKCCDCGHYLSRSPVFVKADGSSICDHCNSLQNLTTINKSFESLAITSQFPFPCKYESNGCTQKHPFDDIKYHEEECEYRIYKCFVEECTWTGYRLSLQQHYEDNHSNLWITNPSIMKPTITTANENKYLLPAFGLLFIVFVKNIVSTSKLCYGVFVLGNSNYASLFEYVLEISTKQGKIILKKCVQPDNNILINDKCIELNVNGLLSMGIISQFDECDFKFTIKLLDNNCSICKHELASFNFSKKGCFCDNCNTGTELEPVNVLEKCNFCSYESSKIDSPKHVTWFCRGEGINRVPCYWCDKKDYYSSLMDHYKSTHSGSVYKNNVFLECNSLNHNFKKTVLAYDTIFFFWFIFSKNYNKFLFYVLADVSKSDTKYFSCEVTVLNPGTKYSVKQILKNNTDYTEHDWYGEIINNTANTLIQVSHDRYFIHKFCVELKISKV